MCSGERERERESGESGARACVRASPPRLCASAINVCLPWCAMGAMSARVCGGGRVFGQIRAQTQSGPDAPSSRAGERVRERRQRPKQQAHQQKRKQVGRGWKRKGGLAHRGDEPPGAARGRVCVWKERTAGKRARRCGEGRRRRQSTGRASTRDGRLTPSRERARARVRRQPTAEGVAYKEHTKQGRGSGAQRLRCRIPLISLAHCEALSEMSSRLYVRPVTWM